MYCHIIKNVLTVKYSMCHYIVNNFERRADDSYKQLCPSIRSIFYIGKIFSGEFTACMPQFVMSIINYLQKCY